MHKKGSWKILRSPCKVLEKSLIFVFEKSVRTIRLNGSLQFTKFFFFFFNWLPDLIYWGMLFLLCCIYCANCFVKKKITRQTWEERKRKITKSSNNVFLKLPLQLPVWPIEIYMDISQNSRFFLLLENKSGLLKWNISLWPSRKFICPFLSVPLASNNGNNPWRQFHNLFNPNLLYLWQGRHTFLRELVRMLPTRTDQEIRDHESWYQQYLVLNDSKKEAIQKWKERREVIWSIKPKVQFLLTAYL